jgi:hypothetical protein
MRTTLAALVFLLVLMSAGKSQDEDEDVNQIFPVFDCAAIAGHIINNPATGTADPKWQEESDRLFAYGYRRAKAAFARHWAEITKEATLWAKLGVSADYVIGTLYEERDEGIEKNISDEAKKRWVAAFDRREIPNMLNERREAAEDMFRERNCHLIGR